MIGWFSVDELSTLLLSGPRWVKALVSLSR